LAKATPKATWPRRHGVASQADSRLGRRKRPPRPDPPPVHRCSRRRPPARPQGVRAGQRPRPGEGRLVRCSHRPRPPGTARVPVPPSSHAQPEPPVAPGPGPGPGAPCRCTVRRAAGAPRPAPLPVTFGSGGVVVRWSGGSADSKTQPRRGAVVLPKRPRGRGRPDATPRRRLRCALPARHRGSTMEDGGTARSAAPREGRLASAALRTRS